MLISIIIPTCNRNDLLSKCLDLLYPQIQLPSVGFNYEVVVSDDSKDNIAKQLIVRKYDWVKCVEGPKRGPAANRNNGVKQSAGEWLIFLDDDCLPQQLWLKSYTENIEISSDALVFEGATNADRPKLRFDEEAPINLNGNKLWSCNFAIKRICFNQINGFDETFPFAAMEDVDFYTRVSAVSKIVFITGALVIHPWRKIVPFKSFQKHLKSHRHFAKKYNLLGFSFRWIRMKIFIGSIFIDFKTLLGFKMKGWPQYIENCILNFCMIFI